MAKIDENAIAKLKALFQDNEKALGSNFSQLIDFFNDNKVTDNGDGTFSVGNTIINVNDIVQEPEFRSIILSQLATKADDSKVVHDNHDGTEQLNGTKVQPFNKLSDTIGGRNYLLNSDQPITISEANNRYTIIPTKLKTLSAGNYIFTADVSGLVGNQTSLTIGLSNPSNHNDYITSDVPIINGTVTKKMTVTDGDIHTNIIIYSGPGGWGGSAGYTAVYSYYQFIKSDVVKDWTPAPEDKADTSLVSTLQTQVDNSAVGTNLLTNTGDLSANWTGVTSISTTTEYNGHPSMGFTSSTQQLASQGISLGELQNSTKYISSFWAKADNAGDKAHTELWGSNGATDFVLTTNWVRYTAVVTSASDANANISHSPHYFGVPAGNKGNVYIALPKLELGSHATDWCPNPEDKVNVSDMRKPASDVLGLEDIKSSLLPNGTDLYTLINTSGQPLSYYVPTYVSAQSMVNKPTTKLSAFKLNTASVGDNTSSNYNYTFLTLKDNSDGSSYEALLATDVSGAVTVTRPWYKVADDIKVAHLSGANNFDTVPTVNNTPLLTSDKLPDNIVKQGDVIGNINYVMYLASYPTTVGQLAVSDGTVDSTKTKFITTTNGYPIPTNVTSMIWETPQINMPLLVGNVIAFYDLSGNFISANAYDATTSYQLINIPKNAYNFKISCGSNSLNGVKLFSGSSYIDSSSYPIVMGVRIKDKMAATVDDVNTAISTATANMADVSKTNTFSKQQIFSTNPTNGTQVYPIYATVDTDADATTLISSLQSSGFSGMIGVPES